MLMMSNSKDKTSGIDSMTPLFVLFFSLPNATCHPADRIDSETRGTEEYNNVPSQEKDGTAVVESPIRDTLSRRAGSAMVEDASAACGGMNHGFSGEKKN